ncbi:MAG: ABC transporter substrate-binding protein [Pseudomonadota bacterium]
MAGARFPEDRLGNRGLGPVISRRSFLGTAAVLAAPAVVRAQDQKPFKIFQITYRGETDVERGFRDYLEQRGVPVEIIHRSAGLDPSRVPQILEEVRAEAPDLVYTWGTPVTLATFGREGEADPEQHITDIPGVFTMVSAPVGSGLVTDNASSGRNITGTSHVVPPEPQIRAMQAYQPFERLGIIYTPTEQNAVAIVDAVGELQDEMGFVLDARPFPLDDEGWPDAQGGPELVEALVEAGAEWLYFLPDTFLSQHIQQVAPQATALRLPTFSAVELLQTDALLSLISRYYSLGQLVAYKAEQILLEGRRPANIPVETLERFALIINMPIAKAIDLYPPLSMLSYASVLTE